MSRFGGGGGEASPAVLKIAPVPDLLFTFH